MISDEYERDLFAVGHSLGGAIASLAAPSIKAALPDAVVKLYTFGASVFFPVLNFRITSLLFASTPHAAPCLFY
jgi:predicted lipase